MMRTWPLQEARSHLRELFDNALTKGPQRITRHGRQAVVVISAEEWEHRTQPRRSFGELLTSCPLEDDDLPPRVPSRAARRTLFD
jgi:prevent-host-death family protein